MRYLLARESERLLTDELGDPELERSIRQPAFRKVQRAVGKERCEVVEKRRHHGAGQGADRMESVKLAELGCDSDLRCNLRRCPPSAPTR